MYRIKIKKSDGARGFEDLALQASLSVYNVVRKPERRSVRSLILIILFLLGFLVVSGRVIFLSQKGGVHGRQIFFTSYKEKPLVLRPDIVDRHGRLLATDVPVMSLYADPRILMDSQATQAALIRIFPSLNAKTLHKKLNNRKKAFVWIKRNLGPQKELQIHQWGMPGLGFQKQFKRVYPNEELAAHILGSVNVDNKGLEGIEYYLNHDKLPPHTPLRLSIDMRAQYIVADELKKAVERFGAKGAVGIVMEAHTGRILALVSLPTYDPNKFQRATSLERFNRATLGAYELGSIIKSITIASALDSHTVKLQDTFDVSHPLHRGRFTIHDFHTIHHPISTAEVLIHSSNIGTALISLRMGESVMRKYFQRFGFLKSLKTELPEAGYPIIPKRWSELARMTMAYGHGFAVSPLQALVAFDAVVNGGVRVKPTFLYDIPEHQHKLRVISKSTSATMRRMLREVVTEGTGRRADLGSYEVLGKTGTAEKVEHGVYVGNKVVTSFVSAYPTDNPQYVMIVSFDEPHGTKKTFGYKTAGWNAAPVSGLIIKRLGPLFGILPETHKKKEAS